MASWVWALDTRGLCTCPPIQPQGIQPELTAAPAQTCQPGCRGLEKHIGSREGETLAWCLPQPSPPRRPAVITVPQILLLEIYSQLNPKAQRAAGGKGGGYTTSLRCSQLNHTGPPHEDSSGNRASLLSNLLAGRWEEGQGVGPAPEVFLWE